MDEDAAGPSGTRNSPASFVCSVCGKAYKYKKGLTAHAKKAHTGQGFPILNTAQTTTSAATAPTTITAATAATFNTLRTTSISTAGKNTATETGSTVKGALQADIFDEIIEDEEGASDVQLSGASVELAHAGTKKKRTKSPVSSSFKCLTCDQVLRQKHTFDKHCIEHKLRDGKGSSLFNEEELSKSVEEILCRSLREVLLEKGDDKKKFVNDLLGTVASSEWNDFVSSFKKHIMLCISRSKAIVPSQKYEEHLVALNKLLNNTTVYSELLNSFKLLAPNEESSIPGMVLYRLLSKVMTEMTAKIFDELRSQSNLSETEAAAEIIDENGFVTHVGKFIQKFYAKGVNSSSSLWLARCACVRKFFVIVLDDHQEITAEMISKNSTWENNLIKLNSNVTSFFMSIELIIVSLLKAQEPVTADTIIDILFQDKNRPKLETWHVLTSALFPELESFVFMKDLITAFIKMSLKLEVDRLKEVEVSGRPGKYALRTNLKRN